MKTTVFEVDGNDVKTTVQDEPAWQPFVEYEGKRLERVRVEDLLEPRGALMQLVEIAAGGSFAMHSSPDAAFCQVVRGRGKLGLPDGRELRLRRSGALRVPARGRSTTGMTSRRARSSPSASSVSRADRRAAVDTGPQPPG